MMPPPAAAQAPSPSHRHGDRDSGCAAPGLRPVSHQALPRRTVGRDSDRDVTVAARPPCDRGRGRRLQAAADSETMNATRILSGIIRVALV